MTQPESMKLEKEIFLREQMASLYLFAIKTILTLSTSALAFNAGFSMALGQIKQNLILQEYVGYSWIYLLLSFTLSFLTILIGISLQYAFFNNLQQRKGEFSIATRMIEIILPIFIIVSFSLTTLAFMHLLVFSYFNFLV